MSTSERVPQFRSPWTASLVLVLAATAAGIAAWPRLPVEVAFHFDAGGRPTATLHRSVAVLLVPALALAALGAIRAAIHVDPPADDRVLTVTVLGTTGLLVALHLAVLAFNLGYDVETRYLFPGSLLWASVVLGYAVWREQVVTH